MLAVLELEKIAGGGAGEILGIEAGELADIEGIFAIAEDVGIMAGAALDTTGAGTFAFVFTLSLTLAGTISFALTLALTISKELVFPIPFALTSLAILTFFQRILKLLHTLFHLFHLLGSELSEVVGIDFG